MTSRYQVPEIITGPVYFVKYLIFCSYERSNDRAELPRRRGAQHLPPAPGLAGAKRRHGNGPPPPRPDPGAVRGAERGRARARRIGRRPRASLQHHRPGDERGPGDARTRGPDRAPSASHAWSNSPSDADKRGQAAARGRTPAHSSAQTRDRAGSDPGRDRDRQELARYDRSAARTGHRITSRVTPRRLATWGRRA